MTSYLGAVAGFFVVYLPLRWQHWQTYHTMAEFWGDIFAIFIGIPVGAVLGLFAGVGLLIYRRHRF
jgi:cytochrome bd-type quinol oxidase subunit 1